ncbi:hypothetical protein GDO86_010564 [Hymenochirus boettgeri]|uniref:Uncharacterized protein n=1 Tax=Hymenochirus boettgeri TaxID=247094 RepID=A0A8T2JQI9_9PIPI|nr:hypothetical protein GDO86_010564 [Hymenochirus boettgeri]
MFFQYVMFYMLLDEQQIPKIGIFFITQITVLLKESIPVIISKGHKKYILSFSFIMLLKRVNTRNNNYFNILFLLWLPIARYI